MLRHCTLPLTGQQVVDRVITNLGVFDIANPGFRVIELASGVSVDEVQGKTEGNLLFGTEVGNP